MSKCGLGGANNFQVDEAIGNFWQTVPEMTRKSWLSLEVNDRNRLGIYTLGDRAYKNLMKLK